MAFFERRPHIELGGPLHLKVDRLLALEGPAGVDADLAHEFQEI